MKVRKKAVLLAAVLVLGLSACGGTGNPAGAGKGSAEAGGTPAETTKGGTTVNVGDFTVTVPEGWLGVTEANYYEEDENGNAPTATDAYSLVKGGKSKKDVSLLPTAYINYYANKSAQEKYEANDGLYEGTEKKDFTIGGKSCKGLYGETKFDLGDGDVEYFKCEVVYIPASATSCFRIYLESYSETEGQYEVYMTDSDMTKIVESLKENAK